MTYEELAVHINKLTEEQKQSDVIVYDYVDFKFKSVISNEVEIDQASDVLDDGYPYLYIDITVY